MGSQIKSKKRVKDLGEVFTASREVEAMLDLIPLDQFTNPLSTWLEPTCGNGNFLIAILARKCTHCPEDGNPKLHALKVLSSLYGVDIDTSNVQEAKARLLSWITEHVTDEEAFIEHARAILDRNIIACDFLKTSPLPFAEYIWEGESYTLA